MPANYLDNLGCRPSLGLGSPLVCRDGDKERSIGDSNHADRAEEIWQGSVGSSSPCIAYL